MSAKHRTRPCSWEPRPPQRNPYAERIAASVQSTCLGWVVIWSAWRQAFTAFSAITGDRLIIDETSVVRLLARMREVEVAMNVRRSVGSRGQPVPRPPRSAMSRSATVSS